MDGGTGLGSALEAQAARPATPAPARRFCLVLIKPSHYDDDGYVIRFWRSPIPSNSLAALYGLARDCADRAVLGPDVAIDIHPVDETNTRIRPDRVIRQIREAGAGMVMLVGVQSNQFPRALDIARPLREAGIDVAIGGFHVSGVLSMLKGVDADLDRARAMGLILFAGEAEDRMEGLLQDAWARQLKPLYNYMNDLPGLAGAPPPMLGRDRVKRTAGSTTSFDAGRGCPYQCSFCTIINVQGRKSRRRSPEDIERIVRENLAVGQNSFFITDDNFARNKDWEPILDRLIHMREVEKLKISLIIQVDTLCHRLPNFIDKCARAGVRRVFIGLENINPDNLAEAKKKQNRITEYRKMLLAWKDAGVLTYAGYILGFENDTRESVMRDIDIIKRELPVDILEFFFLTPLPGSEDHQKLVNAGRELDPDLNKYDLNHVCNAHPRLSREEWEGIYRDAWKRYYTPEHIETIFRRNFAKARKPSSALLFLTWFMGALDIEKLHPLETGLLRVKHRLDRRPGLKIEPFFLFYPRYWAETAVKLVKWRRLYARLARKYGELKKNPDRKAYTDLALTPVEDDEADRMEMLQTDSARAYVEQQRRMAAHTAGAPAATQVAGG